MTAKLVAAPRLLTACLLVFGCAFGQTTHLPLPQGPSSPVANPAFAAITGPGYLQAISTNDCVANKNCTNDSQVWITNVSALQSNGQVTLTFAMAGGSNGLPYDVFATTALACPLTNAVWTWMGQGYQNVTYTLPALTEGSLFLTLGTPLDSDGDGLTDAYELLVSHSNPNVSNSINSSMLDGWAVLWNLDPFAIYDQQEFPTAPQARLGYWQFNNGSYAGTAGQLPIVESAFLVPDWSGYAVSMSSTNANSQLVYNVVETNGQTNFDCANGTIRFWFQPNWSTGSSNTFVNGASFFHIGSSLGSLYLTLVDNGATTGNLVQFAFTSNLYQQEWSFQAGPTNGAAVNFLSNHWYQIALAFSPTNIAFYTNGALVATGNSPPDLATTVPFTNGPIFSAGNGVSYYPSAAVAQASGFAFGCLPGQPCAVRGQLDELETFNYPLTPQAIAAGFPTFAGCPYNVMTDSDYDGRSDLLELLVDGTNPNDPGSVAQCRLGYWRFDSDNLMAEQGQLPLSYDDISLTPSWSGSALNINSDPASQITYWDVFTNGWANINCRQGCLRFWFKPNWTGAPVLSAPFVYLGNPNPTVSRWALSVTPGGAITFATASNSIAATLLTSSPLPFDSGHWMQIVLNYGSSGTSLYTNGMLAATGRPVTNWPNLADRNLGMVIGNNTAYNNSINGQFDEIETFNYQLAPSNILSNFQIVQAIDSDLDGIPDLLEDIVLPVSRPFLGAPVVIVGTIEAEQFDMGGPGIAYHNVAANPESSYRSTGMFITNCDDLGLGYCLDQTRAGEWAQYTINVLVAQNYTIETRVAGIETNGVFECEFANNGFYTNTGPLTITITNWTNVSAVVWLTNGVYTMKLHFLANGTDGAHVGRFNYISIYPWWQAGFTSTNTNTVAAAELGTNNDWTDATNNAAIIQSAVNNVVAAGGGTVSLPVGTYYVAQSSPDETKQAFKNAAVTILTNNIEIAGAGKTNTILIGYNRATTIFYLGADEVYNEFQCTNFTIRDMTIEAQPHLAVYNITNTIFEPGQLLPQPSSATGSLTCFQGNEGANLFTYNILITNCQFLYDDFSILFFTHVSNCVISHCDFNVWGGTNVYAGFTNNSPTNTPQSTTYRGSVGVFCGGAPVYNINILENTYNGNTNLASFTNNPFGYVNTNIYQLLAPDGFVWFQTGGNFFIARNTISNYALEGIQLNTGPSSVVGNTYVTLVSNPSCVALAAMNGGSPYALTGSDPVNFSTCFIGNQVYGGRYGEAPYGKSGCMFTLNFSGNNLTLYPPLPQPNDYPGAAAGLRYCASASVFGNTLASGGYGVVCDFGCGSAVIMNNNFANVTYRGIGLGSGGGSLSSSAIFNNILGQGSTFHVQLPFANSFGWFLRQNQYLNPSSNNVPPFLDPISSAVHISD